MLGYIFARKWISTTARLQQMFETRVVSGRKSEQVNSDVSRVDTLLHSVSRCVVCYCTIEPNSVAYNDAFRQLLQEPRWCSASKLFLF